MEALRSRGQGGGDDDGRRRASSRPAAGCWRIEDGPGLHDRRRRGQLERAEIARSRRRLLRGRLRLTLLILVVERTDPSAAVAHGVDALNNSLGFADPASMYRYFSKTS